MKTLRSIFIIILTCLFLLNKTYAAKSNDSTVSIPMDFLLTDKNDIQLRGQWDAVSFPIPILEHQEASEIEIALSLSHSGNIDMANIWLSLGSKRLAAINLEPNGEMQQIKITLLPDHLEKYKNVMTLNVQHQLPRSLSLAEHRVDAAEAITNLVASESYIKIKYKAVDLQPTLSHIDNLIRSGQLHNTEIKLISFLADDDKMSLTNAGLFVQGWTLRSGTDRYNFQYHNYHQDTKGARKAIKDKFSIIYGLHSDLADKKLIPKNFINNINGPFIGTFKNKGRWTLVVSGKNKKELLDASRFFSHPQIRLPQQPYSIVSLSDYPRSTTISRNTKYPLTSFIQQKQFGTQPLTIPLRMPTNFLVNKDELSHINLMLTHPKVMPGEAAMVLRVNGKFANSMPLRSSYWRTNQHYRLSFPMDMLEGGVNEISLELYGPEQPSSLDAYPALPSRPFIAEIGTSSTIAFGGWVNYIKNSQKKISINQLLFLTMDNGKYTQINIANNTQEINQSIWMLLAHLTDRAKHPLSEISITKSSVQTKPFMVNFNIEQENITNNSLPIKNQTVVDEVRNTLIYNMIERPHQIENSEIYSENQFVFNQTDNYWPSQSVSSDSFSELITIRNGGKIINFNAQNDREMFDKFSSYLNDDTSKIDGEIEVAISDLKSDNALIKSIFILYPYSMAAFIFFLLICFTFVLNSNLRRTV